MSICIIAILAACGTSRKTTSQETGELKPGWDAEFSEAFMADCMASVVIDIDKDEYCRCMLDELSRLYSYNEAQKLTDEALAEVAGKCLPAER